jgi:hypothetical protein
MKLGIGEKGATIVGSTVGGGLTALLVWEGARLFHVSDPFTYVAVVLSALLAAVLGGAVGDWAYNAEWAARPS